MRVWFVVEWMCGCECSMPGGFVGASVILWLSGCVGASVVCGRWICGRECGLWLVDVWVRVRFVEGGCFKCECGLWLSGCVGASVVCG